MQRKHLALPVAAALALSLSACGKDSDNTTSSTYNPTRIAKAPDALGTAMGERPGSPANPKGISDTSPSIPARVETPEKKEQPFGQGSPQTSMKGVDIPVARTDTEKKGEGTSYD
jgi:hypothetical protein